MANLDFSRRLDGEGTIRKRNDGRWEGRYTDPVTGKQKSIYAKKQIDVKREMTMILSKIYDGTYVSEDTGITVSDYFFDLYLRRYKRDCRPQTVERYIAIYKNRMESVIGQVPIGKLKPIHIQDTVDSWNGEELGANTLRSYSSLLMSIMDKAIKDKVIKQNPITPDIVFPKGYPAQKKILLDDLGVDLFFKALDERWGFLRLPFMLLFVTGMRGGELCALRWSNFSDDMKKVHVKSTIVYADNELIDQGETKTENGNRCIPIPDTLLNQLCEYKEKRNERANIRGEFFDEDSFLFTRTSKKGEELPYSAQYLDRYILQIVNYVKKEYNYEIPEFSCHLFRHMYASNLYSNGVKIKESAELLGHNISTLLGVYTHGSEKEKCEKINQIYEGKINKIIRNAQKHKTVN